MGQAGFVTRAIYSAALEDEDYSRLRSVLGFLDRKIGVWYWERMGLTASQHWSRKFELPWAICEAMPLARMTCLDVGSGFSPLPVFLAANSKRALSLDVQPSSHSRGLLVDYGGEQVKADIRDYAPSERFDRIFCISTLEHVRDYDIVALIERMRSWLNPGGKLIMTMDAKIGDSLFGIPQTVLVRLAQHFGIEVGVPADLLCSSDFGEEGQYVGEGIGIFYLVVEGCNEGASEVRA